jgi:hypothetical protein
MDEKRLHQGRRTTPPSTFEGRKRGGRCSAAGRDGKIRSGRSRETAPFAHGFILVRCVVTMIPPSLLYPRRHQLVLGTVPVGRAVTERYVAIVAVVDAGKDPNAVSELAVPTVRVRVRKPGNARELQRRPRAVRIPRQLFCSGSASCLGPHCVFRRT